MAGKRARGTSKDAGDLPQDDKKIKTEQPDPQEENIFEAARRRREAHNGPSKDSSGPASSASSRIKSEEANAPDHDAQSYEAWEKRWKDIYPSSIMRAVGAVRKRTQAGSTPPQNLPPSVYVVIRHVVGQYIDTELDVLGTYATAASANEHAMVYYNDQYRHLVEYEYKVAEDDSAVDPDYGISWHVGSDGCLSMTGTEEHSVEVKVFVSKQVVKDHPPEPKAADPVERYPLPPDFFRSLLREVI